MAPLGGFPRLPMRASSRAHGRSRMLFHTMAGAMLVFAFNITRPTMMRSFAAPRFRSSYRLVESAQARGHSALSNRGGLGVSGAAALASTVIVRAATSWPATRMAATPPKRTPARSATPKKARPPLKKVPAPSMPVQKAPAPPTAQASASASTPSTSPKASPAAPGVPLADLEQIRKEREDAMARVEELEMIADDRNTKLKATEQQLEESEREKQSAVERMQELEAKLSAVEARAKGLQDVLSNLGSAVGGALRNTEIVAGDLSLYDTALKESADSKRALKKVEFVKDQTQERAQLLEEELNVSKRRLKVLEAAEERAKKLSEGVKQIFRKIGADNRGGLFSSFFRRSEDDMIQDTLEQIDDLKK